MICTQVIEHVPDDNALLKEIKRILKGDGYSFISSVVKKPYGFYIYRNRHGKMVSDPTHEREYKSKEEFEMLLKNYFKIEKTNIHLFKFPVTDLVIKLLVRLKLVNPNKVIDIYLRSKILRLVKKIKIPFIDLAVATYFPIVYVEFFSTTRKFDGRRYGKKIEDVAGSEVLRRIFGGSEISKEEHAGRYYHQALKARKVIEEEIRKAFKKVDCIVSPVVPRLPHKISEKISIEEMFQYDALTCPYNLVGNCALALPVGKIKGVPTGIQLACDKFQEEKLFQIAKQFED